MYICVCRAVTDSAIRQAVAGGARTFRELNELTGCSSQCGRCVGLVRAVLDDALSEIGAEPSPVELRLVSSS